MLTSKSIELAKILQKRKVNIACVQETRWVGSKARNADRFKMCYSGRVKGKNGVCILVDRELRVSVAEVRRVDNILMVIKLVVGGSTLNVISAYTPQAGLDEEIKKHFWEGLDEVVWGIPSTKKLFIGGDFNGHIGSSAGGLWRGARWCDRGLCEDCKVIPSETLTVQHRLLVMDAGIVIKRKKRFVQGQPRITWGALAKDTAHELEGQLLDMGA
ncbi:PREDICTED: uncharacterized protein LOC109239173 [Nicotiana attenuata]|uniref:uncharacterized protein LOC109239173 n=1 Tax=Nicotiana attenuata TaxID=49451 RepID=UPI000904A431|nr:PREDICTED: uncharacterized protein LOC109239173 [Nicotiana attenuata]